MSCEPGCNHHHHGPRTGFGSWRPSDEDPLLTMVAYDQIHEVLKEAELEDGDPLYKHGESLAKLVPLTRSLLEQLATLVITLEGFTQTVKNQKKEINSLKLDRIEMLTKLAKKTLR